MNILKKSILFFSSLIHALLFRHFVQSHAVLAIIWTLLWVTVAATFICIRIYAHTRMLACVYVCSYWCRFISILDCSLNYFTQILIAWIFTILLFFMPAPNGYASKVYLQWINRYMYISFNICKLWFVFCHFDSYEERFSGMRELRGEIRLVTHSINTRFHSDQISSLWDSINQAK